MDCYYPSCQISKQSKIESQTLYITKDQIYYIILFEMGVKSHEGIF